MGRLTGWSYKHPYAVVTAFGMAGGGILGLKGGSLMAGLLGASLGTLLTLAAMQVEPHPPEHGPQQ